MVAAAKANGVSSFSGLGELNKKESPRLKVMNSILNKMGVKTKMILVNNLNKATQSLDLVPTFLDLLGIHDDLLISDIRKQLDGVSLLREVPNDRSILSMNTNALRKWDPRG